MEERIRFVKNYRSGLYSMTELCLSFGVRRKTGYKWVKRFEEGGLNALEDKPRVAKGGRVMP